MGWVTLAAEPRFGQADLGCVCLSEMAQESFVLPDGKAVLVVPEGVAGDRSNPESPTKGHLSREYKYNTSFTGVKLKAVSSRN